MTWRLPDSDLWVPAHREGIFTETDHIIKKFWRLAADIREMQTGKTEQRFKNGHGLSLENNSQRSKLNSLKKKQYQPFSKRYFCHLSLCSQSHHLSEVCLRLSLASHLKSSQPYVGLSDILFCEGIYHCITKQLAWRHSRSPEPSAWTKLRCLKFKANSPALLPCHCPCGRNEKVQWSWLCALGHAAQISTVIFFLSLRIA